MFLVQMSNLSACIHMFQDKMYYAERPKKCNRGCRDTYRESDEDHNYAYHKLKSVALLCGCGFGDIFVPRVRKHLLEVHGLAISKRQVLEHYFWHRLPKFAAVRRCEDPQNLGCLFRSPIKELVGEGHDCRREMKKTRLPQPDKFLNFIDFGREYPLRGFPTLVQRDESSPPPSKKSTEFSALPDNKPSGSKPNVPSNYVPGRVDHQSSSSRSTREKFPKERNPDDYRNRASTSVHTFS